MGGDSGQVLPPVVQLGLAVRVAALSQLGRLLTRMGRYSQALGFLEEAVAWEEEDVDAVVALVDAIILHAVSGVGSADTLGRAETLLGRVRVSDHAYTLYLKGRLEEEVLGGVRVWATWA